MIAPAKTIEPRFIKPQKCKDIYQVSEYADEIETHMQETEHET